MIAADRTRPDAIQKGYVFMNVVVGMSGGVDSSVAAYLLQRSGYTVYGTIMKIWDKSLPARMPLRSACFSPDEDHDLNDAQKVCDILSIPLHVLDCSQEFHDQILSYFKAEYEKGRTPNPCVFCNRHLKFDLINKKLRENGLQYDFFATGHYARIIRQENGYQLGRALDRSKDQSYFLYRLAKDQLAEILFPLGELTKDEVRSIARSINLPVSSRPESQDFYAGDYRDLLSSLNVNAPCGRIVNRQGRTLGMHRGLHNYTIGQRKKLGVCSTQPLYVLEINADRNEIVVGSKNEQRQWGLIARSLNLLVNEFPPVLHAKTRSTQEPVPCTINIQGDTMTVQFAQPLESITPGQSIVFYDADIVVGGGIIDMAI